jgi:hypothetical protein
MTVLSLSFYIYMYIGETAHDNLRGIEVRRYQNEESEDLSLRI